MPTVLRYRNPDGSIIEIGPEHPDYARLVAESEATPVADPHARLKLLGVGVVAVAGSALIFYGQYVAMRDAQKYGMKLQLIAGLLLTFGLISLTASLLPARIIDNSVPGSIPKRQVLLVGLLFAIVAILGIVAAFKIHYGMLASLGYR